MRRKRAAACNIKHDDARVWRMVCRAVDSGLPCRRRRDLGRSADSAGCGENGEPTQEPVHTRSMNDLRGMMESVAPRFRCGVDARTTAGGKAGATFKLAPFDSLLEFPCLRCFARIIGGDA